jgi:hypothetical protein
VIACVLRTGGRYGVAQVQRLAADCARWADRPVVCLSDVDVPGVRTIPLVHDWPGWWAKLELFRPDVFPAGTRVFYADLDTTIVGPLAPLLARPDPFLAIGDFYRRPPSAAQIGLGSGLLQWTAGEQDGLYHTFAATADAVMARFAREGDQGFLERERLAGTTFWESVLPGAVVSYKVHCRQGVPPGARVVCFHGHPKPWDVPELAVHV